MLKACPALNGVYDTNYTDYNYNISMVKKENIILELKIPFEI